MSRIWINLEHPRGSYASRVVRRTARDALAKLDLRASELSVLLTTDEGIRDLNREFRGKDRPTDVLSFPAGDPLPGEPPSLGDLAISLDTARRVAEQEGRTLAAELSRYVVHGLLHLLGYDHEASEEEARRMAEKEEALLGTGGMLRGT